jgi:fructokinase
MIEIGVDFGGTKIEVAALTPEGSFLSRVRAPNPGNYSAALETVRTLVTNVEAQAGERGSVGVGTPGSISPRTGLIRNANTVWLNGKSFKADLAAVLGREIRMVNDANCLALSEAVDGAGAGSRVVFAVIVGTGCGGGWVVNGQLIEGANGLGGEWGHIPLPWADADELPAPECWCGLRGCLETWISGSGLRRDYQNAWGEAATGEEIIARARAGEPNASRTWARYVSRFGRALAVICNVVDPDIIVVGGGISNVPELYSALPDAVRPYTFSREWSAPIVAARWGDSSGVRGAARLWRQP